MTSSLAIFTGIILTLSTAQGCDEAGEPEYTMTCDHLECHEADETSDFSSGNDQAFTCTWLCRGGRYYSYTFWSWDGGCWELDSTYEDAGICY